MISQVYYYWWACARFLKIVLQKHLRVELKNIDEF
jgi:hypothetical protein